MPDSTVILITGLLRDFPQAISYLEKHEAFTKYEVLLSTWTTELDKEKEALARFEVLGGKIVSSAPISLGRYTSVASQHLSLTTGLNVISNKKRKVMKTRSDWMVTHDLLSLMHDLKVNKTHDKILVSGFIPSSPYFVPDGHFMSTAGRLSEISTLDIIDLFRHGNLHPEQNFFIPQFHKRNKPLESWLALDIGTQFDALATRLWMSVRLKSGLYFYVIGEYFKWVLENLEPIKYEELQVRRKTFKEFTFGVSNSKSSRRTRLILRNQIEIEQLQELDFPNTELHDLFWRGFDGESLTSEECLNLSLDLEQRIKNNSMLRLIMKQRQDSFFESSFETSAQLIDIQNQLSWARERLRQLEGTDTL